jgi:tryptophan synthase alpha chain
MNRIDALFARLRREDRRALMPFLTAGDPDLETTAALLDELLGRRGLADLAELGIPYSDPIADGPVIAASYTRALGRGVRLAAIFQMLADWRRRHPDPPIVTMVSYAIVHRHGVDRYLAEARAAGVDGLIVPDLPVEEAEGPEGFQTRCAAAELKLIQLVTPTTPRDRAVRIARSSSGFLYYVSVAGITGERQHLPPELAENVAWLRTQTELPICIGFGISRPEHVRQLAPVADGLIVGSAIVRRIQELAASGLNREALVAEIGQYVEALGQARAVSPTASA